MTAETLFGFFMEDYIRTPTITSGGSSSKGEAGHSQLGPGHIHYPDNGQGWKAIEVV